MNPLKKINGMIGTLLSMAFRGTCPHNTQVNELLRKKTSIL